MDNPTKYLGKYAMKGAIPWNKGKTGIYSEETRKKWSLKRKGSKREPFSNETIEKMKIAARLRNPSKWMTGIKRSEECRKKNE